MRRFRVAAVCAGLTILVWLVFGQTLRHGFVNFDDNKYVYENAEISRGLAWNGLAGAFTHPHANLWHPLTTITHMLDCQVYGLNAGGHHFTNVILHNIAVVLLFLVLVRMTGGTKNENFWCSAFVAALFAIHPMRVESVAWIAERKDVLSAVFFVLTIGAYYNYVRNQGVVRYAIVMLAFACGLMSKAMLVTLPAVLLLLDYWPLERMKDEGKRMNLFIEKIPLLFLSAASTLATVWAQKPAINPLENLPLSWRINNAFVSAVIYIEKMFWPANLAVFYPHPRDQLTSLEIAVSILCIAALTILAIIFGRQHRYVFVGWFWYAIMLLPVIGLIQAGLQGHADRFTYLPHIGLFLIVSWGTAELSRRWANRKVILGVTGSLVIAGSTFASWRQASYWHDSLSLWQHALAVTSNNDTAELCMSSALLERGRLQEAVVHSQAAVKIQVANAGAFGKVPVVLTNEQTKQAIDYWTKRIEARPEDVDAHNSLGVVLIQSGAVREAIAQWQASLKIKPSDGNAANNLAWVLATVADDSLRDGAEAVKLAENAVHFPGGENPMVLRTLAAAYAENGNFPEAIETASRAAEMAQMQQNHSLAATLRAEAESYRQGKPHRETVRRD